MPLQVYNVTGGILYMGTIWHHNGTWWAIMGLHGHSTSQKLDVGLKLHQKLRWSIVVPSQHDRWEPSLKRIGGQYLAWQHVKTTWIRAQSMRDQPWQTAAIAVASTKREAKTITLLAKFLISLFPIKAFSTPKVRKWEPDKIGQKPWSTQNIVIPAYLNTC